MLTAHLVLRIKLALRNIQRHRLRSFLTIFMIVGSVCSVVLFHGLSDFLLDSLRDIAAENQYGHMQVGKKTYWEPGSENRNERMFELKELDGFVSSNKEILSISGRLNFFGMISNGDFTVGGSFVAIDTSVEKSFQKSIKITEGTFFKDNNAREVVVGRLLAKQLHIHTGSTLTVLTNTVDGAINAMDLTVVGIFSAGLDEIDKQVLYVPLALGQSLLDTTRVDFAVLKFKNLNMPLELKPMLDKNLQQKNPELQAKTWQELAVLFEQLKGFYAIQNRFLEGILLVLMFLGILNAVSMSVVERTGEIGTLRALGEKRKDVIIQFLIESTVLSFFGIFLGTLISFFIIKIFHASQITAVMPGTSVPIILKINFLPIACVYIGSLTFATALLATFIPAKRAANLNIINALGKNI